MTCPVANTYASQVWKLKYELAEWNLKEHYHTICNMQLFVDYYTASEECLRVELHNTKAHVTGFSSQPHVGSRHDGLLPAFFLLMSEKRVAP